MEFKGITFTLVVAFFAFLVYYKQDSEYLLEVFKWQQKAENDVIALATMDISNIDKNEKELSKKLYKSFSKVGFAYVTGLKDFDEEELHKWTKWFFNLPLSVKMAIAKTAFNSTSHNMYRGYFPIVPGKTSYKEAFETGLFEKQEGETNLRNSSLTHDGRPFMRNILEEANSWPNSDSQAEDAEFKRIMQKHYKIYHSALRKIMQLCVMSLGRDKTAYDNWFKERSIATFRLLHYPTRADKPDSIPIAARDGDIKITTAAHYDTGILTLLSTFNYSGLQIRPTGFRNWIDVPPKKNHLVVNIGALLAHLADKKFVATDHRVIDTGGDRYSLPMFFEPHVDADLSETFSGKPNDYVGIFTRYGPWMTNRTSQFVEYATTEFGVYNLPKEK